jgi:hypothetical protein
VRDPKKGSRLGLRNVSERMRMQFGDRGYFASGSLAEGGFINRLVLPLELRK